MKESNPGPSRRQFLAGLVAGVARAETVRRVADNYPDATLEALGQEVADDHSFCPPEESSGYGQGFLEPAQSEGVEGAEEGPSTPPADVPTFS